ncbi:hypothetical protein PG993_013064 [Apiospora rasikravindrae]|uniref:Rhodopsin domain-containing protein n=1 Tax=Apiospora rasikravindrae TaxID=990691 RepID=A0ABR1RXR2_9PEZI
MADGVDIPNRGPELQAVCIALLVLAVTAVALRCYTRVFILRAFGLDDAVMVFATVSFILFTSSALTGVHYGTGRHHKDLDKVDIQQAMKYWWFCYIWYCITMITSKISIGVFLLRITVVKAHKWIIYVVLFLSVITGVVFFFVTLLQCQPLYYFWDKDNPGTCLPPSIIAALTYLYSAFSVLCDFTFALLPLHMIMGLQMRQSIKYSLVPILGMACVRHLRASIAVVVRFVFVHTFEDPDFLWATLDIAIWSDVEQGLAICAGCLATLQPLIKRTAQSVGLWSIHTGPGASGLPPQTIGSMDRHKASQARAARENGNFTLATFQRVSEDDEESLDLEGNHRRGGGESKSGVTCGTPNAGDDDNKSMRNNKVGIFTTTTVTVKKEPAHCNDGNDMYNHFNESEERLTHKSSKDFIEEGGPRVSPRSPLDSVPPHQRAL